MRLSIRNLEVFLVIGGCGFLGSRLITLLLERIPNCKIVVVDKNKKSPLTLNGKENLKFIYGDLSESHVMAKIPLNIKCIFYLAAAIPWNKSDKDKASIAFDNLLPLIYLVEKSKRWRNLKQIVFSSSVSIYTPTRNFLSEDSIIHPVNIYGAAKASGESFLAYLKTKGVIVTCLRYSSIYGYGQYPDTVLPTMIRDAIKNRKMYIYRDGSRTQDFLYRDDAANANILAYIKNAEGTFNIGSGVPVSMEKLARVVNNIFTDGRSSVIYIPGKEDIIPGYKIDISKAKRVLGFKPMFQIEKGLEALRQEMGELDEDL